MWRDKKLNNSAISLKRALRTKWCGFVYVKQTDGSYRVALGTTEQHWIPDYAKPKKKRRLYNKTISFWDLEKQEWRCLRRTALIGYWVEVELNEFGELQLPAEDQEKKPIDLILTFDKRYRQT